MRVDDIRFEIRGFFDNCPTTLPAKRSPQAHYVLVENLPSASRIRKEIAQYSDVPYNVLKVCKLHNRVSLLWYPKLGKTYHPRLHQSKILSLHTTGGSIIKDLGVKKYGKGGSYPILHSIHLMLDKTSPEWQNYHDQDERERKLRLFRDYNRIGQSRWWDALVRITPGTDQTFYSA